MTNRKLRPWVRVAISVLVAAIIAGAVNLLATTTAPCGSCGEQCSAAEAEIAAVEGHTPICENCR